MPIIIPPYQPPQRSGNVVPVTPSNFGDSVEGGYKLGRIIAGVPQAMEEADLAAKIQANRLHAGLDPLTIDQLGLEVEKAKAINPLDVKAKTMQVAQQEKDQPLLDMKRALETGVVQMDQEALPMRSSLQKITLGNENTQAGINRDILTGAAPSLVTSGITSAQIAPVKAEAEKAAAVATAPGAAEAALAAQEAAISGLKEKKAASDWGQKFYSESGQGNFGSEMQPVLDPQSGAVLKYRYVVMGANGPEFKEVDPFKASPEQIRAGKFAQDIVDAEDVIAKHTLNGWSGFAEHKWEDWSPNAWQTPEQQEFRQAVNILVHAATKSDYSRPMLESSDPDVKTEVKKTLERLIPQFGDTAPVLTRKASARRNLFESMKNEAVGGANPIARDSEMGGMKYFKSAQDAEQSGYKGRAMIWVPSKGSYQPATVQ